MRLNNLVTRTSDALNVMLTIVINLIRLVWSSALRETWPRAIYPRRGGRNARQLKHMLYATAMANSFKTVVFGTSSSSALRPVHPSQSEARNSAYRFLTFGISQALHQNHPWDFTFFTILISSTPRVVFFVLAACIEGWHLHRQGVHAGTNYVV